MLLLAGDRRKAKRKVTRMNDGTTTQTADGYEAVYHEAGGYWYAKGQSTFGWVLTCPACQLKGTPEFFGESCAGECFCPKCDAQFIH